MKRTINILIPMSIGVVFTLSSCKKYECNCECTDNTGNKTVRTMEEGTKQENESECESFELPGQISCELTNC